MATPQQYPTLLTIREAAAQLAVGRTTIYQLINRGAIRTVRLGSKAVRVPRAELDRLVSENLEERA